MFLDFIVIIGIVILTFLFLFFANFLQVSLMDENKKQFIVFYFSTSLIQVGQFGLIIYLNYLFKFQLFDYRIVVFVLIVLFILTQIRIWHSFYMNFLFFPSQFKKEQLSITKPDITMSFNEVKIKLDKCRHKIIFWRRALYLEAFTIFLFASLAFVVKLSTGNYILLVLLAASMILIVVLFCFSFYKILYWNDKTERYSLEMSLWKVN